MKGDIRYQLYLGGKPHDQMTRDASHITVHEAMQAASSCQITLNVDICKNKVELLDNAELTPGIDNLISVVAWLDGVQTVLFHGVITGRKTQLKHGGAGSTLTISAQDKRILLDRKAQKARLLSGNVSSIATDILGTLKDTERPEVDKFDQLLFDQKTTPLSQTCSDLALLNQLCGLVGAEFWLDWKLKGNSIVETPHFAIEPKKSDGKGGVSGFKIAIDQSDKPVLRINTAPDKCTMLDFSSERRTEVPQATGSFGRVDIATREVKRSQIDGPTNQALGTRLEQAKVESQVLSAGGIENARMRNESAINDASWSIDATAQTTVYALKGLLRPRNVVKVEGTGKQDDGEYLVWSVEHTITPQDHQMQLALRRNAMGSKS